MRARRSMIAAALLLGWAPGTAAQPFYLSETVHQKLNLTPGNQEFVEIAGPPNASLFGYSLLVISHDDPGLLRNVVQLGSWSTGSNGLLLLRQGPVSLLPLPSHQTHVVNYFFNPQLVTGDGKTFLLGHGQPPAHGSDLDADDDGTLDTGALQAFTVIDAVGSIYNQPLLYVGYADDVGFENFGEPDVSPVRGFYRIFHPNGTPCRWAGGDFVFPAASSIGPFYYEVQDDVFGFLESGMTWNTCDPGNLNFVPDSDGDGIANGCDFDTTYAGFDHVELGVADLAFEADNLKVSGFSASGADGVTIALPQLASAFHVGLAQSLNMLGDHLELTLAASGSLGGAADVGFGSATVHFGAAGMSLHADYGAIGASQIEVTVLDHGEVVGSAVVAGGGAVATIQWTFPAWPHVTRFGHLSSGAPGFLVGFQDEVAVTLTAGPSFAGDTVKLTAAGSPGTIDHLSRFELRGINLGAVIVGCESGLPSDSHGGGCPGSNGKVPRLELTGCPRAGRELALHVDRGLPSSLSLVQLGLGPAALPLGAGCALNVYPLVTSFVLPLGANGTATLASEVPPVVVGASISFQAFVIDVAANPLGASTSNGAKVRIDP